MIALNSKPAPRLRVAAQLRALAFAFSREFIALSKAGDLYLKLPISSPRGDRSEYAAACLHPKWRFAQPALNLKVDRGNVCARFGQPHAIGETTDILNAVSAFVPQPS